MNNGMRIFHGGLVGGHVGLLKGGYHWKIVYVYIVNIQLIKSNPKLKGPVHQSSKKMCKENKMVIHDVKIVRSFDELPPVIFQNKETINV